MAKATVFHSKPSRVSAGQRRQLSSWVPICGVVALGWVVACSSSSTTISQGSNDAGAKGGNSSTGGATSTAPNCLKLGVTGCTASCCESGTACVSDKCVIKAPLANGAACTGPAECNALTCLAGTCGPPPCRNNLETCNNDFPCCSGQYCGAAGTCQTMGVLGAACSATQPCGAGLQCNTTTNVCEACPSCGGTACCGTCNGTSCTARLITIFFACLATGHQKGDACTSPSGCCSGNCVNLVCANACLPVGGLCSVSSDCCSGECLSNTCVYSGCAAAGNACNADANCCSNHCGANAKCQ